MDLKQECLEEFLDLSRELQVKGLAGEKREEEVHATSTMVSVENEEAIESFNDDETDLIADGTDDAIYDSRDVERLDKKKAESQDEMEVTKKTLLKNVNTADVKTISRETTEKEHTLNKHNIINNSVEEIVKTTKVDFEILNNSAMKSRTTQLSKSATLEHSLNIGEANNDVKTTKMGKTQNILFQDLNVKLMNQSQSPKKKTDQKYCHILKDNEDIDSIIQSIMGKNESGFTCKVCDRIKPNGTHMVWHIESHIGGTSYECHICKQASRTRGNLVKHVYKIHGKEFITGVVKSNY